MQGILAFRFMHQPMRRMPRSPLLLSLAIAVLPANAGAQALHVGASATALAVRAQPIAAGAARSGAYLTQPVLMVDGAWRNGALSVVGMLNLEGLTLADGELAPGTWGEGFVDKRHPHTYLHELVASARIDVTVARASLSVGRGFAPFGTDDPMSRPFLRFPSNHHLAQIPERLVAIAAIAAGPVILEAGTFNGDEPTDAESLGSFDRVGDSWATRVTILPVPTLELQGSYASVESPEVQFGGGADQRKWSASARWNTRVGDTGITTFAEWARTMDQDGGVSLYGFRAWLLELDAQRDPWRAALRYEDATRPEEERTRDRFRSPRPHTDFHLLGITRWRTLAAHVAYEVDAGPLRVAPFVEAGISRVDEIAGGVLQPETFFGDDTIRTIAAGIRIGVGHEHGRMGRYGVAAARARHNPHQDR